MFSNLPNSDPDDEAPPARPSRLDCNTAKGKTYISHQNVCLGVVSEKWKSEIYPTNGSEAADIDAIAVKNGVISAVMEVKSREMTLSQLKGFGSYLVTFDKLIKIRNASASLAVPGFLIVSLLKDNSIVYWQISDDKGNLLPRLECKVSATQATCNGGEANRYNAYLFLDNMKVLRVI